MYFKFLVLYSTLPYLNVIASEQLVILPMSLPLVLGEPRSSQPLLVLRSTPSQSIFPLLYALCNRPTVHTILYTFLYSPSTLVDQSSSNVETHEWTAQVPGYSDLPDVKTELLAAIKGG